MVVLDDWHVLCYDNELNLLWNQQLMDIGQMRETYKVKAMAVLVSPHVISTGDQGSVIVGGSYAHRSHDQRFVIFFVIFSFCNFVQKSNLIILFIFYV